MRYFIVVDNCGLVAVLPALVPEKEEVFFFIVEGGDASTFHLPSQLANAGIYDFSRLSRFKLTPHDRVMVSVANQESQRKILGRIRRYSSNTPVLVIDPLNEPMLEEEIARHGDPSITLLPMQELLRSKAQEKWHQIEIRKKVERMKGVLHADKPLWILTQNDPDPDAIASAMALQAILGRNDKTAPIVTQKSASRNENISMIKIIGARIREVKYSDLARAPQVAIVDAQPSFFRRIIPNLRIVVDHHPATEEYSIPFKDLQITYGATSTIFTEYLVACNTRITQRLGTALYYGIKTDTLLLGRPVSRSDFSAFTYLWQKANHQQIKQMERPRLQSREIHVFIKALKEHTIDRGCLFAFLGDVPKEDLVPRLADFVMQIGDVEFAVVWGRVEGDYTFSARSLSLEIHAGEVMRAAFGHIGSAGGHQSMARATVTVNDLSHDLGTKNVAKLNEYITRHLRKIVTMEKQKIPGR